MKNKKINLQQIMKNLGLSTTTLNTILGILVLAGGTYGGYTVFKNSDILFNNTVAKYMLEVVDGDTIKLTTGETIRLSGINAPEKNECFGPEATNELTKILQGKKLRLEKDILGQDNLGRVLAHIVAIVDSPTEDNIWVNKHLLKNGYAKYYISENVFMEKDFQDLETQAKKDNMGLWGKCKQEVIVSATNPNGSLKTGEYEQRNDMPTDTKCIIKGNISSDNKKVYLLPNCPNYESTKIDSSRGEQYFCTEEQAKKLGFARAFMCPTN